MASKIAQHNNISFNKGVKSGTNMSDLSPTSFAKPTISTALRNWVRKGNCYAQAEKRQRHSKLTMKMEY